LDALRGAGAMRQAGKAWRPGRGRDGGGERQRARLGLWRAAQRVAGSRRGAALRALRDATGAWWRRPAGQAAGRGGAWRRRTRRASGQRLGLASAVRRCTPACGRGRTAPRRVSRSAVHRPAQGRCAATARGRHAGARVIQASGRARLPTPRAAAPAQRRGVLREAAQLLRAHAPLNAQPARAPGAQQAAESDVSKPSKNAPHARTHAPFVVSRA
jgi:hypothetical protein